MNKLDLLLVIDNSKGMARTQKDLLEKLPAFVEALAKGHRLNDDSSRFPAALDMHVGVVTTNMGVPGVEQIENCSPDGGDDGRLQHAPIGADCDAAYPPFLSYSAQSPTADIAVLGKDLSCIAPVGTNGCDYVQPLEAALKALSPTVTKINGETGPGIKFLSTSQEGMLGRGDQLGGARGFVREDAVLAIVVMTDDDDTSMQDTEAFRPAAELPRDSAYRDQDPKLRAYSNPVRALKLVYSMTEVARCFGQLHGG